MVNAYKVGTVKHLRPAERQAFGVEPMVSPAQVRLAQAVVVKANTGGSTAQHFARYERALAEMQAESLARGVPNRHHDWWTAVAVDAAKES